MNPFVLLSILQVGAFTLLAPGVVGLLHWLKSRLQNRRGPVLWQPYRDLGKLLRKGSSLPQSTTWVFSTAPPIMFASCLLLGLSVPKLILPSSPNVPALGSWTSMDLVLVAYLLGLAKFISGLAALDAAAPFGSMGTWRQFFVHIMTEPVLLTSTYALALMWHTSNLPEVINHIRGLDLVGTLANPAIILILLVWTNIFLAEDGRLPIDNPNSELELTMIEKSTTLKYSGRSLALVEWAAAMKLTFSLSLLASLVWPWSIVVDTSPSKLAIATGLYLLKIVVLVFGLALWEATQAKLRLRDLPGPVVTSLVLALVGVVYIIATRYLSAGQ